MPLVANSDLPSFYRLREEGEHVLSLGQARRNAGATQLRELHIGLLNMMPDAALEATERQFFRLIGGSNQIAQFHMHPFTLAELERSPEGRAHVESHYQSFSAIRERGLDALIITGANVVGAILADQIFWKPLIEVVDWASEHVASTLCSCLATHAMMEFRYGSVRQAMPQKRWGVFSHRVLRNDLPLVAGVNTRFDVPHSRYNEITPGQFDAAGLRILVISEDEDVHLAASPDGLQQVFFQGHPEYDANSLLKEYKREVGRYLRGERTSYPDFPKNYLRVSSQALLEEYRLRINDAVRKGTPAPEFPERWLAGKLDNTWRDTAAAIMNNWVGCVYRQSERKIAGADR
ncbi:MAG: homoserine O-succinyltransferase MetA [Candidatus Eutrophobiaceae bacterium]